MSGHGEKISRKKEQAIAALLSEPTQTAAAARAGVGAATLRRWLQQPEFQAEYRRARRGLVEVAVGRLQDAAGRAVETLAEVAANADKDADRVRAAVALLDFGFKGLGLADLLDPGPAPDAESPIDVAGPGDVVRVLCARIAQVDSANLPTPEKARLTATLADALLRAIGVDTLDKRLEALHSVLVERKGK